MKVFPFSAQRCTHRLFLPSSLGKEQVSGGWEKLSPSRKGATRLRLSRLNLFITTTAPPLRLRSLHPPSAVLMFACTFVTKSATIRVPKILALSCQILPALLESAARD